jgi:hypothetical protein
MKNGDRATKTTETLLYQLLETELGGVQIYETALRCVVNDDLREEWEKYLGETREHVEIARKVVQAAGLDPDADVPARNLVRLMGKALVEMMETALTQGDPDEAQLTACECVVEAETKDHQNWELVGQIAKHAKGDMGKVLRDAHKRVEKQEDHHLYHSKGWARELWLAGLGFAAALPPPEEKKEVETAIGAARAKNARGRSARHQA